MRCVFLPLALVACSVPAAPAADPLAGVVIPPDLTACQAPRPAPAPLPGLVTAERLRAHDAAEHAARLGDEAALRECAGELADLLALIERHLSASAVTAEEVRARDRSR